jgi:hypothetical protein
MFFQKTNLCMNEESSIWRSVACETSPWFAYGCLSEAFVLLLSARLNASEQMMLHSIIGIVSAGSIVSAMPIRAVALQHTTFREFRIVELYYFGGIGGGGGKGQCDSYIFWGNLEFQIPEIPLGPSTHRSHTADFSRVIQKFGIISGVLPPISNFLEVSFGVPVQNSGIRNS